MQTARIPLAILLALEIATTACTSMVQPCLNVAPMDDGEEQPEPSPDVGSEPVLAPCLTPQMPQKPPMPQEPPVTPCLDISVPEEPTPPPQRDPPVGPCLRIAPPRDGLGQRAPIQPIMPKPDTDIADRTDVLDKLAHTLPPDVVEKLRNRED